MLDVSSLAGGNLAQVQLYTITKTHDGNSQRNPTLQAGKEAEKEVPISIRMGQLHASLIGTNVFCPLPTLRRSFTTGRAGALVWMEWRVSTHGAASRTSQTFWRCSSVSLRFCTAVAGRLIGSCHATIFLCPRKSITLHSWTLLKSPRLTIIKDGIWK